MGINFHFYGDDTQIYLAFDIEEAEAAVAKVEEAVQVIRKWMSENFLCLNDEKTEVLVIGSKSALQKFEIPYVTIGSENSEKHWLYLRSCDGL